jgi:hypothetical protein
MREGHGAEDINITRIRQKRDYQESILVQSPDIQENSNAIFSPGNSKTSYAT